MPSHRTSERLAPEDPRPRSDTPCVVGCATRLEVRRNRLKPGTMRNRSSNSAPAVAWITEWASPEIFAGGSAAIWPVAVMEVLSGSTFSAAGRSCAAAGHCQIARTQQTSAAPAHLRETRGCRAEHDLVTRLIDRGFGRFPGLAFHQSQILQNCI